MKIAAIAGLVAALCAAPMAPSSAGDLTEQYALRQRCGEQAAKFFAAEGNKEGLDSDASGTTATSYEAHFNPKTLKCFISYTYESNPFRDKTLKRSTSRMLVEVNENKTYGSFFGYADGTISDCKVNGRSCNSEAEWVAQVAALTGE